jgi:hypothetical protein
MHPEPVADEIDVASLIRKSRMAVCLAYYHGGDRLALEELALASLGVAPYVVSGELLPAAAWDALQEVAEHLGMVEVFGQDAIQEALAFGPRVCEAAARHAAFASLAVAA